MDYKEFKNDVYTYYEELFPRLERMPLLELKTLYKKNILKFVKIRNQTENVGFLIYVTTVNNPYIWLSYFAIYPEFQNQQYGSKAIQEFRNYFKTIDGIYGEIESVGFGKSEEENQTQLRRVQFWESLGFELLPMTIQFYKTIYTPCVLKLTEVCRNDEEILQYGFSLYQATVGEKEMKKNCFILNQ